MKMQLAILTMAIAVVSILGLVILPSSPAKAQASITGTWNIKMFACHNGKCVGPLYITMTFDNGNYHLSVPGTTASQHGRYTFDGRMANVCSMGGTGTFANTGCTQYSVIGGNGVNSLDLRSTNGVVTVHMTRSF
jgi:hypothetical protein